MQYEDRWLDDLIASMRSVAPEAHVLELGCGTGQDTAVLDAAGFKITASDISDECLKTLRQALPDIPVVKHDIRQPLPFADEQFDVILASLCLHYFSWPETSSAVDEIRRCLKNRGLFICRLNSTKDHLWGASGYAEISENYYDVNGESKRFFDEDSLYALFSESWNFASKKETTIYRYEQPKTAWELVLEKRIQ